MTTHTDSRTLSEPLDMFLLSHSRGHAIRFIITRLSQPHTIPCAVRILHHFDRSMEKPISGKVVAQHNSRESCWIIVHGVCPHSAQVAVLMTFPGKVYDVTEFLDGI